MDSARARSNHVAARWARIGGVALLLAFLASSWLGGDNTSTSADGPRVRWSVASNPVEPFTEVGIETPVQAKLTLTHRSWIYAVAFDPTRGVLALFPSTQLICDAPGNPLPAGEHMLPGHHLDNDLSWHTSDAHGPLSFLLVVSESPIAELEQSMKSWRQVGNRAFPTRPLLGSYAPEAGMEGVPPRSELPTEVLRTAHGIQRFAHDGVMAAIGPGRYASVLRLQVAVPTPGQPNNALDVARKKLESQFGELMGAKPPK